MPSEELRLLTSEEVRVVSIMGRLLLAIGEIKVDLSIRQARELAELLQDAAEHAEVWGDESEDADG